MTQNIVESARGFAHSRAMVKKSKSNAADNLVTDETAGDDVKPHKNFGAWLWSEVKFFAGLAVVMTAFLTLVWGHFKIPSESMQPTLEVGDHLYVSKFAYGYSKHSLPFLLHKLPIPDGKIFSRLPKRGDVVVFRSPRDGVVMIKRAVGLPGDTVQTRAGLLYVNGELVPRMQVEPRLYREHKTQAVREVTAYSQRLTGMDDVFMIYERNSRSELDNTVEFTVPEGHVFFMGDNRDNSTDSRAPTGPGMVPLDHLMGRADRMMFSFKRCNRDEGLYCPPKRRVMEKL